MKKVCTKCGAEKALGDFYAHKEGLHGRASVCKTCQKKAAKKRRQDGDPEAVGQADRESQLRARYGISLAQYDEMFEAQGGLCAICREPETSKLRGKVKRLAVDHDHETGRLRKLLCCDCNRAIGLMHDKPALLRAAAIYLEGL